MAAIILIIRLIKSIFIITTYNITSIFLIMLCRHSAGDDLSTLGLKELKQLERQTRTAVERVRSKMVTIDIVIEGKKNNQIKQKIPRRKHISFVDIPFPLVFGAHSS
jgi:hypothetical protein